MELLGQVIHRTPRLLRFAGVGGLCFALQLLFLLLLANLGVYQIMANTIGFVFSAQVNFFLSNYITWLDRHHPETTGYELLVKLGKFNLLAVTLLLGNQLVFGVGLMFFHYFIAGIVGFGGILVGMGINYLLGGKFIFRSHPTSESIGSKILQEAQS